MKTRTDLLNFIASEINAKTYLEIGVFDAENFNAINVETKYGVDPNVEHEKVIQLSSNEFFDVESNKYDLIFIDGDHSFEQSLLDLQNSLKHINEGGVIVMHDAFPHAVGLTGLRKTPISEWCGDVYKTVMWARQQQDLGVITWKQDYGCAIITKGELRATSKPELEFTFENLHKDPIDSVGLVDTNEVREYFSIFREITKTPIDFEWVEPYDNLTREELKAEYKDKFPDKKIGRKSDETLIRELRNG